ncbi:uncharacterized protein LY89DRAFT_66797 [Mollisia scopiformis]|uniref:Uncharacterized protein n=1 Tax=Mollisia scopiformis TaxID=149040 RepID=A0A194X9N1_MOLSC|nr:uncharacterized protein LY89DRAFT_66797 [Mollisia scopiformis]KUJ16868.1 hypothetical protein LY89DRAFT_66797 [Mollisia scopiformis]
MTNTHSKNCQRADKEGKSSSKIGIDARALITEASLSGPSCATRAFVVIPLQASNHENLNYDATTHHEHHALLLPSFRPVKSYATTSHDLEQGTTASLHDLNTFQNLEYPSQDELIQSSESYVALGFVRNVDIGRHQGTSITNDPTIDYSNVLHETTPSTERIVLLPIDTSLTDKKVSLSRGYENTIRIENIPLARLESRRKLAHQILAIALEAGTGYTTTHTAPYPETLQVYAGSYQDFNFEVPVPFTTEHMVESHQLEAWKRQTSGQTMTLAEKLEMNKHAWGKCE